MTQVTSTEVYTEDSATTQASITTASTVSVTAGRGYVLQAAGLRPPGAAAPTGVTFDSTTPQNLVLGASRLNTATADDVDTSCWRFVANATESQTFTVTWAANHARQSVHVYEELNMIDGNFVGNSDGDDAAAVTSLSLDLVSMTPESGGVGICVNRIGSADLSSDAGWTDGTEEVETQWTTRAFHRDAADDPTVVISGSSSEYTACVVEILAAVVVAANPKGPLGHPLHGALAGPVGV